MIQFNLLPDVKIYYLRANRQKHIVMLVSVIVTIASLAILAILLSVVYVAQKKNVSDLNKDIKSSSSQLQSTANLTRILTVQNQLKALPALHNSKPVVSRLFGYLTQSLPPKASNTRTTVDLVANTISISGTADSLNTVNQYVDNLKATKYSTDSAPNSSKPAFSQVTLTSFGRDSNSATYTITFSFDPAIFSEASNVTFTITPTTTNAGQ